MRGPVAPLAVEVEAPYGRACAQRDAAALGDGVKGLDQAGLEMEFRCESRCVGGRPTSLQNRRNCRSSSRAHVSTSRSRTTLASRSRVERQVQTNAEGRHARAEAGCLLAPRRRDHEASARQDALPVSRSDALIDPRAGGLAPKSSPLTMRNRDAELASCFMARLRARKEAASVRRAARQGAEVLERPRAGILACIERGPDALPRARHRSTARRAALADCPAQERTGVGVLDTGAGGLVVAVRR
jgi:hypothetical protein